MDAKYGPSPLWEQQAHLTREAAKDLSGFKSRNLGFWDPQVNGVRQLKALLYNLAAGLSAENRDRLRRIRHRAVGDPITVTYGGDAVCVDYLQAVLELDFIAGSVDLTGARVLEIGGGYGRTCHAILSNHDIDSYGIVDLDGSLDLAQSYLGQVLDRDQLAKVRFVRPGEVDDLPGSFDLTVSINAFGEMPAATVREYLTLVDTRSRRLYLRDAVGRCADPSLDGPTPGAGLATGLQRFALDIHDSRAVTNHARAFVAAHRPGGNWIRVADAWAPPWSFYWQVLYRNGRGVG